MIHKASYNLINFHILLLNFLVHFAGLSNDIPNSFNPNNTFVELTYKHHQRLQYPKNLQLQHLFHHLNKLFYLKHAMHLILVLILVDYVDVHIQFELNQVHFMMLMLVIILDQP